MDNPFMPYECQFTEEERKAMIGQALTQFRKEKSMSQKEVAAALGISQATYSTYERGRTEPPAEILVRLSYLFRVSVDHLIQRDRLVRNAGEAQEQINDARKQLDELKSLLIEKGQGNEAALDAVELMASIVEQAEKLNNSSLMKQFQ